jgi:hypothetical protein
MLRSIEGPRQFILRLFVSARKVGGRKWTLWWTVCGSTALLLDLYRFFGFLILYTVGRTLWTGGISSSQGRYLHRTTQTENKRTRTSMPWVGFEPMIPVFERAKTVHATDREATVMNYLSFLGYLQFLACFPNFEKCKKFWEELISYFPLIRHAQHIKRRVNVSTVLCVFVATGTCIPSCCLATMGGGYTQAQSKMIS